jgi:hypothetical protein
MMSVYSECRAGLLAATALVGKTLLFRWPLSLSPKSHPQAAILVRRTANQTSADFVNGLLCHSFAGRQDIVYPAIVELSSSAQRNGDRGNRKG